MDERERKGAASRRAAVSRSSRGRRPDGNAQRPGAGAAGSKRPGARRRSSRARRRRRNNIIRCLILLILVAAAAGGFIIWQRYGSSDERADLNKYYGLEAENDLAVVVNNEVVRKEGTE